VFVYFTADDRDLPQRLFVDGADSSSSSNETGKSPDVPESLKSLNASRGVRFERYLPADRSFVNTIANYPYPYLINHAERPDGTFCWEFPCMTPSDWQAQHFQKSNNPK